MTGPDTTRFDPIPFDPRQLRLGHDLRRLGTEPTRAAAAWRQVRRGVWLPTEEWKRLTPEHKHAAAVHAAAMTFTSDIPPMFVGASAAAVLGLPRVTTWPAQVQVLADSAPLSRRRVRGTTPAVRRCAGDCSRAMLLNGLTLTPPARVVIDLARTDLLDNALVAADQALRRHLCTAQELAEAVHRIPHRGRGRRAAALVVELADGDSMSAGESLSRLQMFRLNLPKPVLQQEFFDQRGLIGRTDFAWRGLRGQDVVGEFDGRIKYHADPDRDPREAEEVLWREKQREDRLRKLAHVARWTWTHALDPVKLARELADHGVHPLPRNTWFDLAPPAPVLAPR